MADVINFNEATAGCFVPKARRQKKPADIISLPRFRKNFVKKIPVFCETDFHIEPAWGWHVKHVIDNVKLGRITFPVYAPLYTPEGSEGYAGHMLITHLEQEFDVRIVPYSNNLCRKVADDPFSAYYAIITPKQKFRFK